MERKRRENAQRLLNQKTISSPSDSKKGIKPACPNQIKENLGRYESNSNSFLECKKNDLCITSSTRDVAKNHKKKTWVKKTSMPTRSGTKKREPLSRPRENEILLKEK